jgi:hypothetical protein
MTDILLVDDNPAANSTSIYLTMEDSNGKIKDTDCG